MANAILITITNECNLRCEHCYKKDFTPSVIKLKDIIKTINKDDDINSITLYGGEPLLPKYNKNVLEIIKNLPQKISHIGCTSNLYFNKLDEYQLKIIGLLDDISTSWTPNRFKNLNVDIWINNIYTIKKLFPKLNITVLVTLTKDVVSLKCSDVYNFLESLSIDCIKFEPYIGNVSDSCRPDNSIVDNWLTEYFDLIDNSNKKYTLFSDIILGLQNNTRYGIFNRNCVNNILTLEVSGLTKTCPNIIDDNNITKYTYKKQCLNCKYLHICGGSCRLLYSDDTGCQGYPKLFNHIKERNYGNKNFKW